MKRYERVLFTGLTVLITGTAGVAGVSHPAYQDLTALDQVVHANNVSQTPIEVVEPIADLSTPLKMEDSGKTEKLVVKTFKHYVIPYESVTYTDRSMAGGTSEVKIAGQNGERVEEYEIIYINGQETGRVLLSNKVTKQPVMEIIAENPAEIGEASAAPSTLADFVVK